MSNELWAGFVAALAAVLVAVMRRPQARADARKANAEADVMIEGRLLREIARLDEEMKEVRAELASVKATAEDEKRSLQRENRALHAEIARLTLRVEGLESILKAGPITEEMQALVDELDRKTAKRGRA